MQGATVAHARPWLAEPGDIAGSVLVLAADQAGWITGQAIMAHGGNSFGL
jgi:NAD(P)-dependent dehydrogenase (short-subunit alcohol dehydrogenase family)